jgi:hypothetical protein
MGSRITNGNDFFGREMPSMPELGDIYSNFFSDEHMCMRAAESDGARRREGEEKSGATLYDGMQLVENWFALVGEEESEGRRWDYTVQRQTGAWSVFPLLTVRKITYHKHLFSSYPLPIDRTSPRPHRRQELSYARSSACSIQRRARGESIVWLLFFATK